MENSQVVYKLPVQFVYNKLVFRRWSRTIREYMFYPPQYTPRVKEKEPDKLSGSFFCSMAYSPQFVARITPE